MYMQETKAVLQEEILPGDVVATAAPVIKKPQRLQSLDALRGFDMFWIVSGEFIFHAAAKAIQQKHSLIQNETDWQISKSADLAGWENVFVSISNQLHHSVWNGFTFYDLIFPLFIFIAGVSMPYSYGKFLSGEATENKQAKTEIYKALIRRTLILIFLGTVVNGLFKWQGYENTRLASVLGRIALACFFAAIIYLNTKRKGQIVWFVGILLSYWAIMTFVPVPGYGAGVLTPEGNLAAYVDRVLLPGKLHRKVYDPEGLLSTIPAICSALLGVFTGEFLQNKDAGQSTFRKAGIMLATGVVLLLLGWLWSFIFPINKTMWTSSFVLFAGGWSLLLLAILYGIIDVGGFKKWSTPLVWMGANSILIYLAAHGLINFESTAQFLFGGLIEKANTLWQPFWLAIGVAVVQLILLWFLYKRKWFLKV
jgi:predicted acyltransferase